MDKVRPVTSKIKEGSPSIFLRGENLEYYRNIEYLKEVTRQANALLDRSNAKYENILDDQKLGYKVRAQSNSDSLKSISPEMEGKCRKCGLAHGAANFCIVEQIMDNEKQIEQDKRKSRVSKGSWKSFMSTDTRSLKQPMEPTEPIKQKPDDGKVLEKLEVLEKMTPSQVLDTYEVLSARFGPAAGRQFLMANSAANPPQKTIEEWMTRPEDHPKKTPELAKKPLPSYSTLRQECLENEPPALKPVCPEVSEEVRRKMEEQVRLIPPCLGQPLEGREKNWRAIFGPHRPKPADAPPEESIWSNDLGFESSSTEETCNCKNETCVCGTDKICNTPKVEKNCVPFRYEEDNENNYLLTVRNRIRKRRETRRKTTRLFSFQTIETTENGKSRSEEFFEEVRKEQYKTLKNCLVDNLKNETYDNEEFDKNVHRVADMASPETPINPRQWDHWLEQMAEQKRIEERDEVDSQPSDIQTDQDNQSLVSHSTGIDYDKGRIKPSRIPYADEVYDLIDNLYDKITRKFEKAITKESLKNSKLPLRPTHAYFRGRMTMLSYKSKFFHDVMVQAKFPSYPKRLTPYRVRKNRKMKRVKALHRRQVRKDRKRAMVHGLQLGKRYRKVDQSYKYTPEGGYVGFNPGERQLLDRKSPDQFIKFNFVGDPYEKGISTARIHHDYRLIRRMFEDADNENREDLMDKGMLERLHAFQKKLYDVQQLPELAVEDTDTEDEGRSDVTKLYPPREDMLLLQKADSRHINHGWKNLPKSTETFTRETQIKAGKSYSAERMKKIEDSRHKTSMHRNRNTIQTPYKSTSSTNVKRENTKKKIPHISDEGLSPKKNLKGRCSVRSLTNLLPPLKGQNIKPLDNNEFEETISSLQRELYGLLNPKNSGQKTENSNDVDGANEKRMGSKKNSAVTKLPDLNTSPKKMTKRTGLKKISDESLPRINQRESVENLKPFEELPRRGLMKKTSMLDILSNITKTSKLPLLAESRVMESSAVTENGKLRKSAKKKTKAAVITKQNGYKAWR